MKTIEISVDEDCLDKIIQSCLIDNQQTIQDIIADYSNEVPMFTLNKKKDLKKLKKLDKAFNKVIKYLSVPNQD